MPPCKCTKLLPALFCQGCTPGPKPNAADYEEVVEKMLLNAMYEYACLVLTVDAFPNEVKQTQWAKASWQAACEEVGEHFECSMCMVQLISGQGSWARGFLKDAARNNFKVFKFKEGLSEEIRHYNQELRHTLLRNDAFHHKNQEDVTGFGEHRIIVTILQDALFEDNKSYGVKYKQYFNPISINLLALVFTMIEFLINEWSTGEQRKATFRSRNHSESFEAHYLRDLEPTVTTNIQKRMFRTLIECQGFTKP
ncbi:hypothetical protein BJV77DRAFT_966646 [Russula vinacea]|nr:hypothetical protein BJV77DRAFT_966646 [Russula vinacea]